MIHGYGGQNFPVAKTRVLGQPPLFHFAVLLSGLPHWDTLLAWKRWLWASSHPGQFSHPAKKYGLTVNYNALATLLRGCRDLHFVETALKKQRSVITRWFRSKPHAQLNGSDLIRTRQLRPLVKMSLFCWGLIQAREHKRVQWFWVFTCALALLLVVTRKRVVTKEEELLRSKAVLSAGVLTVAHWLCQVLQQPRNFIFLGSA